MAHAIQFDAIVVGAGANGLVAAIVLAKAGKNVALIDRAETVGGQARTIEFAPGFNAAPFALDAGWVPPAVASAIGLPALLRDDPDHSVTLAPAGGEPFALPRDPSSAVISIRAHSPVDAIKWGGFVERLRAMSGFLEVLYQMPAPDIDASSMKEMLPLIGVGRKLRALGRDSMIELLRVLPMSIADYLDDEFTSDVIKAAVGAGGVRDLRQGPRSGGTVFNLLHYLCGAPPGSVRARSWWRDGPGAFDAAAVNIARQSGVVVRAGTNVSRIVVRDDVVTGVVLDTAEELFAPIVVATGDPADVMLHLVDPVWLDPEFIHAIRNIKFRGCTAAVMYAVDKLPDIPGLDGIVTLTPSLTDLERAYDAVKYKVLADRPHVELTATTLRWKDHAPGGKHVLVARVQFVPYESQGVYERTTAVIRSVVPRFDESILHSAVLTPRDIEEKLGLTRGALTHGELMLDQMLFTRPVAGWSRYAMPIDGLYLGGAGTHPGPGIVGAPGLLAAKAVLART